ncbi:atrial natriuretic peptide-converting enzyme isoform X1 [Vidua chalybeata]|uniref:atrial natriuretic peptide-converting enzyme isoform X1 n=1 Tax=Vidua chalybeata TaxID=81927 RepID=UPI0023A809C9|nr:atrial natriuretic peptide-converting enzyme isoform X1 [Vidua chalybeata]
MGGWGGRKACAHSIRPPWGTALGRNYQVGCLSACPQGVEPCVRKGWGCGSFSRRFIIIGWRSGEGESAEQTKCEALPASVSVLEEGERGSSETEVLGTDEDDMGDGCSQKLASAKFLRLLLLILIPCICALILLLVILLTFVGVLEKTCFYSNGSEGLTVNGDFETSPDLLPNTVENSSETDPTVDLSTQPSSWTTTPLSHIDQMNKNSNTFRESFQENSFGPPTQATVLSHQPASEAALAEGSEDNTRLFATTEKMTLWSTDASFNNTERMTTLPILSPTRPSVSQKMDQKKSACRNITHSQCQMLPYNYTTVTSVLSIVKSIEMEKFLKFFSYLNRLNCYQHIMLFGCSLALPECISGGDDSRGLLPCRTFCEAAKEGCEPVLAMVNASWPDFLKCSQFQNNIENDTTTRVCFSPHQEKGKQSLCGGEESFLCASGICIPRKLQCNGYNDCDDWSDEVHCNCSDDVFRCDTGKCLNYTFVCDGYDDCGDLSDEQNCDCNPVTHHQCGEGRCITADWVCDGDHDCMDKSDEINCSCHSQGLVECRNGQCIPSAFQCDGDNDCKDGSDEENCSENQTLCQEGDQRCSSCPDPCGASPCEMRNNQANCSQCEPITLELCMNLPYNYTYYPNYLGHRTQKEASISWESSLFPALVQTNCYKYLMFFACTILVPKCDPRTNQRIPPCRTLCVQSKERCEAVLGIVGLQWPEDTDCTQFPDENSDNQTCLTPDEDVEECSPSHFKCRSGRCVLASRRCDGQADCEDDSDEDSCGCRERGLWECPLKKLCIKHTMICDGFPDCPDMMDEKNCSFCDESELECANHECVPRELWCDGQADCSDSSDEWDCVTLSKNTNSLMLLTVHRSAADYHVCADEWQENLSQLACNQMGLGGPSKTEIVIESEQMQDQKWLNLHPGWKNKNASTLHALLVNGQTCQSRSKVALFCTKEDCGRRPAARMSKRILGGRTSRPGRWPWQCSLQSEPSGHICGCVLIARRWVLTVAHCFEGRENAAVWKVVFGISNLDHPSSFMQTRLVRTIILHPRYNRAVVDYDISIVELDEDINETSYVRPVCLPSKSQLVQPDTYCYITGWGHMGNKMPFKLQEGEVRIISLEQCQSYFDMKIITSRMLCAGYESGTVDSCMGDSGGPLVCEHTAGRWTLFGLTSWGSVCFSKVLGPGVYSNVSHFIEWIERQIYIHTFLLN